MQGGGYTYAEVEVIAAQLCAMSGGNWDKPYTKRNKWRKRAMALICLARGDMVGAKEAMR